MSVARAIARRLFGRSIEVIDLEIAFYKQANHFGTHGVMIASHKDLGLKNHPVRFVFIGLSTPPAMTPRIIEYIWEEARAQGFIPASIQSYGEVLETHTGLSPRILVNGNRRQSEDALHNHRSNALETTLHAIATASAQTDLVNNTPSIDSFLVKEG